MMQSMLTWLVHYPDTRDGYYPSASVPIIMQSAVVQIKLSKFGMLELDRIGFIVLDILYFYNIHYFFLNASVFDYSLIQILKIRAHLKRKTSDDTNFLYSTDNKGHISNI